MLFFGLGGVTALLEARGFTPEDFARLHPGGQLGKQFLRVDQLMHAGEELPRVTVSTPMRDAIYEMSRKRFGITAVVDDGGRLAGVISDGDLRRLIERDEAVLRRTAGECMHRDPRTISPAELASAALRRMEEQGLLESWWATDQPRPRKYYRTTEDGKKSLANLLEVWGRVDAALRRILESSRATSGGPAPSDPSANPPKPSSAGSDGSSKGANDG